MTIYRRRFDSPRMAIVPMSQCFGCMQIFLLLLFEMRCRRWHLSRQILCAPYVLCRDIGTDDSLFSICTSLFQSARIPSIFANLPDASLFHSHTHTDIDAPLLPIPLSRRKTIKRVENNNKIERKLFFRANSIFDDLTGCFAIIHRHKRALG